MSEAVLGKLYLIPCTLGDNEPLEVLPLSVKKQVEELNIFIVENEKSARRFIKRICPTKRQDTLEIKLIDKFTDPSEMVNYLDACALGVSVGVLSEAGAPAIADPGANMVRLAHSKKIKVVPLVGPSSILLAQMASGLNGQSFAFRGYLPIDKAKRKASIKKFEKISVEEKQAQLFIETPYRNNKMLEELLNILKPSTLLCVAVDITLPTEQIATMSVLEWKNENIDLHKRPCIFIFQTALS